MTNETNAAASAAAKLPHPCYMCMYKIATSEARVGHKGNEQQTTCQNVTTQREISNTSLFNKTLLAPFNEEIIAQRNGITVTRRLFQCLRPRAWLKDEIISMQMLLLQERDARTKLRNPNTFLDHTFIHTLTTNGTSYNYNAVRRWRRLRKLTFLNSTNSLQSSTSQAITRHY